MGCTDKIDTDNPARLCLEFASTVNEVLVFTKESGDTFNPDMRLVILRQETGGSIIQTLTVGDGIEISGNDATVTFEGATLVNYKNVVAIWDVINPGYRDVIIDVNIVKNY